MGFARVVVQPSDWLPPPNEIELYKGGTMIP